MKLLFSDDPDNPWEEDTSSQKGTPHKPRQHKESQHGPKGPDETLADMMAKWQDRIKQHKKKGSKGGPPEFENFLTYKSLIIALVIGLFIYLGSGFYRVQEGELALVLRFGKMVRIENPGLRYHFPAPIEKVIVKDVSVVNKIESGSSQASENEKTLILTGDENMVHTNYTVLWKVQDISKFVFTTRTPEQTIRVAAESAVREIIGKTNARLALTEGREQIAQEAQDLLQKILDSYNLGVHIVTLQLQRVEPPAQVIEAFHDLQASRVDADRMVNEAQGYENEIIPRARGKAAKIVQEAEAYKQSKILEAEGEAHRFKAVIKAYQQKPEAVKRRLYNQMIESVLHNVKQKTIVDGHVAGKTLPLLDVNRTKGEQK